MGNTHLPSSFSSRKPRSRNPTKLFFLLYLRKNDGVSGVPTVQKKAKDEWLTSYRVSHLFF